MNFLYFLFWPKECNERQRSKHTGPVWIIRGKAERWLSLSLDLLWPLEKGTKDFHWNFKSFHFNPSITISNFKPSRMAKFRGNTFPFFPFHSTVSSFILPRVKKKTATSFTNLPNQRKAFSLTMLLEEAPP